MKPFYNENIKEIKIVTLCKRGNTEEEAEEKIEIENKLQAFR